MSVKIVIKKDKGKSGIEYFYPYKYKCGNYMRGDSTNSSEPMIPESSLDSLATWIETRQKAGKAGGVRMKSEVSGNKGLMTINKIEVTR